MKEKIESDTYFLSEPRQRNRKMWDWICALWVVCQPFAKMAAIWLGYQVSLGGIAWSSARFYSDNCAAPGFNGFVSSLFTMGSPICISMWFTHAAFVVAYVCAFVATVVFIFVWLYNRATTDPLVQALRLEVATLKGRLNRNPKQPEKREPEAAEVTL